MGEKLRLYDESAFNAPAVSYLDDLGGKLKEGPSRGEKAQRRDAGGRFAGDGGGGKPISSDKFISEAEVGEWLQGSAVPTPVYHQTTKDSAKDILNQGVDLGKATEKAKGRSGLNAFWTSGAVEPGGPAFQATIKVAIKPKNPLMVNGLQDVDRMLGKAQGLKHWTQQVNWRSNIPKRGGTPWDANQVTKFLRGQGHDAIVSKYPNWTLALDDSIVRVIK